MVMLPSDRAENKDKSHKSQKLEIRPERNRKGKKERNKQESSYSVRDPKYPLNASHVNGISPSILLS